MSRDELGKALDGGPHRHGDRGVDDHPGTPEVRRLQCADAYRRQRDRRHGAGGADVRLRGRALGQGDLRPQGQQLLPEPHRSQRAVREGREGAGRTQAGPGEPRGRGLDGDGECRARQGHRRRRLPRAVLEAGLSRHRPQRRRGGAHQWRTGHRDPQGQPEAEGRTGRPGQEVRSKDHVRQHDHEALPGQHEVHEERHRRRRDQAVPRVGRALPEVRGRVRPGLGADGRTGLPGVGARSARARARWARSASCR